MRRIPSPVATATTEDRRRFLDAQRCPRELACPPYPRLLFYLVAQVGDSDVARAAHVEGGLDRRPDIVGVDMAVPKPFTADDDYRVTDASPDRLEGPERVVGRLKEVHDLIAQPVHGTEPTVGRGGPGS